jgi:hypothetical protein
MLFKQIHSLPSGPNWGKIGLVTAAIIAIGLIAYEIRKPGKNNTALIPKIGDKSE